MRGQASVTTSDQRVLLSVSLKRDEIAQIDWLTGDENFNVRHIVYDRRFLARIKFGIYNRCRDGVGYFERNVGTNAA